MGERRAFLIEPYSDSYAAGGNHGYATTFCLRWNLGSPGRGANRGRFLFRLRDGYPCASEY